MIFFDGDHSVEGVHSDLEAWLPKMRSEGYTVFHDYGWAEGVQKAIHEITLPITGKYSATPNMWWGQLKKDILSKSQIMNL
jgi:hypothetical protein